MLKLEDFVIDKEFERLEQSILKNGMLDPIKVWGEPDPLEKDFSIEEINNMPTLSDFVEENTG